MLGLVKQSAGLVLYRKSRAGLEVVLVHPSGAYNRNAPWGIPKGMPDGDEPLEAAARRETREEIGVTVTGELIPLGHVDYRKSRKRVHAWAVHAPDAAPRCASWEVDGAEFLPVARAREVVHPDHAAFLDRLEEHLRSSAPPAG